MSTVKESFGFKSINENIGELTHVTMHDEALINEPIPMSFSHYLVIQKAIKSACNLGRKQACDEIRKQVEAVKYY